MRNAVLSVLVILAALVAAPAQAQTISKYHVYVYASGVDATNPASPTAIPVADIVSSLVLCNLAAPTVTNPVTNPTMFVWDDPVNAGKTCQVGTSALAALPAGNGYSYVMTAESSAGIVSDRAVPSVPFNWQPKPAAPTGLRVK